MTDQTFDALMLMALLDAIPDAVLMSDADGIITRANPSAGTLFGYDPAKLIGQSVNMLMPQSLSDRHDGFMHSYLETGQARIIGRGRAVEGLRSNGQTFPLHLSIGRADHDGNTHFVAILHDISARQAAEEALARSARLDAIGQMTGGISHDFSNILTVVIGNLELLQARITDDETQAMLADGLEAAELGAQLTAGLTAFARKAATQRTSINVNAACKAALGMIKRTFDPHYKISAELGADLPEVLADATQLQSALLNIALNGRDAMPEGGQLIIRSEAISIDDTYIAQELDVAEGDYVRISVTDTGRGMGPDTQQRVFEPFYTTKPVGHGTGLGLAMVYGFVRQSGGHVTIYSEIGHGTTIALYFPVLGEGSAQHPAVPPKPLEQRASANQTVLVVEDNPQVRKLTTVRLRNLGYRVQEAASGDHAAEVLQQDNDIDVVFTDLVMPGELDGLALARHVVASYPNLRILLTSGYAEDILNRQSANEPGVKILRKPYRQSDLAAALSALFDGGSSLHSLTSQVKE
ncbi:PAS/PAC sensor hybrid histidine kinase [Yoonia maricola]|uniref:Sensor protein FixL n=1 Tax=Yoonia maricola TaxID=420999 RepID=A0A2M8WMF8_9RHOB|nr:PAS domain-containing hybrid sensor histidine kinase/response regulator [Yoonia maricola]PJI92083.1 PAS/PAC sensor hybrid histidine kinase [Yoonia maricola]